MYEINCKRLCKEDYNKPCKELAIYLLGKVLIRKLENGKILKGKVVETECYLGGEDKASHSYNGKVTKRNEPMYKPAGTAYVYTLYFGYHCLNISSREPGAVVLLRSLEVISGMDTMAYFRSLKIKCKKLKATSLCNGSSKLCIAMNITKENSNMADLASPVTEHMWLENQTETSKEFIVVNASRIGIGSAAEEWVTKPLRYYILNNRSVSKRDKEAEKLLEPIINTC